MTPDRTRVLITGITGQDGWWLAGLLKSRGKEVFGFSSRLSSPHIYLVDYQKPDSLRAALRECLPHEIYHLACPSCIQDSEYFERQVFLLSVDVTLTFLRWIREVSPLTRLFFASSSETFGNPCESPQHEMTPPRPSHPYAVAKLAGQNLIKAYRTDHGIHAVSGILFNHESHLRQETFVSRKISRTVARIHLGLESRLELGNLDAIRDWSHTSDFVDGFEKALQYHEPDDYVFASGKARTVREFCEVAFGCVGLQASPYVFSVNRYVRPDFENPRVGDSSYAEKTLRWKVRLPFHEWVSGMVKHDISELSASR